MSSFKYYDEYDYERYKYGQDRPDLVMSRIEEEMTDAGKAEIHAEGYYVDEDGRPIKTIGNFFDKRFQKSAEIDYKYNEGKILKELAQYIDATYGQHYSQNKYQATEFIIDGGHGVGFTIGNIMKYAQRYAHKGTPEDWRKDLMKVLHYAIIAIHTHDLEHEGK